VQCVKSAPEPKTSGGKPGGEKKAY
jgi:hypothetical protein